MAAEARDRSRPACDHLTMPAERPDRPDRSADLPSDQGDPPGESRPNGFDGVDDGVASGASEAAGIQDEAQVTEADDADDIAAPEGDDPRESAYGLLQRGHDLMRSRHHAQAATVLARAARIEPRKGSILEALGRAYYNSGQHGLAAETFETLLDVDPSAHYAHYALGQSLKQLGRAREARTHLRLAVALSPNSRLYQAALDRLGSAPPRDRSDRA
jgi:tetratricopeptide (TPR) repeat protein